MKLETLAFVNESWPNTKVNNSVFCRKGRREGGGSVWAAEATVAGTTPHQQQHNGGRVKQKIFLQRWIRVDCTVDPATLQATKIDCALTQIHTNQYSEEWDRIEMHESEENDKRGEDWKHEMTLMTFKGFNHLQLATPKPQEKNLFVKVWNQFSVEMNN